MSNTKHRGNRSVCLGLGPSNIGTKNLNTGTETFDNIVSNEFKKTEEAAYMLEETKKQLEKNLSSWLLKRLKTERSPSRRLNNWRQCWVAKTRQWKENSNEEIIVEVQLTDAKWSKFYLTGGTTGMVATTTTQREPFSGLWKRWSSPHSSQESPNLKTAQLMFRGQLGGNTGQRRRITMRSMTVTGF